MHDFDELVRGAVVGVDRGVVAAAQSGNQGKHRITIIYEYLRVQRSSPLFVSRKQCRVQFARESKETSDSEETCTLELLGAKNFLF